MNDSTTDRKQAYERLRHVLVGLRRRIRRYVLIEGIALTICVLGTLFWASLFLEWGYFRVSNFEPPVFLRGMILLAGIALTIGTAGVWVISRLMRNMHLRSLAMVLERRFPELDDRLILAVESSESTEEAGTRMNRILTDRAINEAVDLLPGLRLGDVFDSLPLRRPAVRAATVPRSTGSCAADHGCRDPAGFLCEHRPADSGWHGRFQIRGRRASCR